MDTIPIDAVAATWLSETPHAPRTLAHTEAQLTRLRTLAEDTTAPGHERAPDAARGWLDAMVRAAAALADIDDIERDDAHYLILIHVDTAMAQATHALEAHSGAATHLALEARTRAMHAQVRRSIERLRLAARLSLTRGEANDAGAHLANEGPIALRHIEISCRTGAPLARTPYLGAYQGTTIALGPDTLATGDLRFRARTIDGAPIRGTPAPGPRAPRPAEPWADTRTAARIARQIERPGAPNPILLVGASAERRRAVLDAVCESGPLRHWRIARCTLPIVEGAGTRGVRAQLANAIAGTTEPAGPGAEDANPQDPIDDDTAEGLRARAEAALDGNAPRRIVLIVENADTLCEAIARGEGGNVADNLRALVQSEPRLGLIVAGGDALHAERMRYASPFYGLGITIALDARPVPRRHQHPAQTPPPRRWPFGATPDEPSAGAACAEDFADQPIAIVEIPPGAPATLEILGDASRVDGRPAPHGALLALWLTDTDGREASWTETRERCARALIGTAPTAMEMHAPSVRAIDRALLTAARQIHARDGRHPTLLVRVDTDNARASGRAAHYTPSTADLHAEPHQRAPAPR